MTHQSIKEIEKEIERLKKKVYKKLGTNKCPDDDYKDDNNWEEWYDGNLIIFNTKLQQAKDDRKEFLEMIDKVFSKYENPEIEEEIPSIFDYTIDKIKEELKKVLGE